MQRYVWHNEDDLNDLFRQVPGEGPLDAELVLIGEAGGEEEARQERPFVGPTGRVLEEILQSAGIPRRDCRIDNVIQRHPPHNRLQAVPKDERQRWIVDLHQRLAALRPKLIVGLGGLALEALAAKRSISNWRGSILTYQGTNGHCPKLIPVYHPAFTFTDPTVRVTLDRDFRRVRDLLDGRIETPKRQYRIRPSIEEVELYASTVHQLSDDQVMTLDIETPGHIACVGFSYDPNEALVVPTTHHYWKSKELVIRAWRAIRAMCQSKVPKVLQHGLYDAYWLRRMCRIEIKNWQWDLMCMHHCLAPQEPHDLAYIASMVQDYYVFWKTEAKDPESVQRYARDIDALYTYNGMDCCEQRGLYDPLYDRMQDRHLLDFYDGHYRKLLPHMLDLMCHGFRVDVKERAKRAAQAKVACLEIETRLAEIAGKKVHAKKTLGRKAIEELLYDHLKLPKHYNPKTGSLTTDIFTLQRLTHKHPKKMHEVGPLIMTHRKQERLVQFLDPKKVDSDGRFRSSYGFDPSTGRFSSSPNPMGTGDDAQNQDRRVRDTFLADRGCLLLRCDLSQAESRIVDMLTLHPKHLDRARSNPWERDVHRETAAIVFNVSEKDVTKDQRYLAKRAKYAGLYDIGSPELSRQLSKEAIFESPAQCQKMIDKAIEDPIRDWQQRVRGQIMRDRVLGNSWGWTFDFTGMRLDRETYKKGYAFNPQSEIGFLMHHWGFYPIAKGFTTVRRYWVNAHVHDELVISVQPPRVYETMEFLRASLERPRRYSSAGPLVIPCTWGLGRTWKSTIEWDRFPSRKTVQEAVEQIGVA